MKIGDTMHLSVPLLVDVAKLVRWVEGIEFRSKTPQMIEWYPQVKLMADTLFALSRRNAELERERKAVLAIARHHSDASEAHEEICSLLAQGDK